MKLAEYFSLLQSEIQNLKPVKICGKVISIKGNLIICHGLSEFVSIGSSCSIENNMKSSSTLCEVVGFDGKNVLLMPFSDVEGISPNAEVEICKQDNSIAPDISWLGRVINAFGEPIDNKGPIKLGNKEYSLKSTPPLAYQRKRIGKKIELGIKAIDIFTSCCYGQRMGIFAGSGIGKSVLISMITKYSKSDVKVIGLIGERSREAKEFIDEYLGEEGSKNAIIVLATGDESALTRKRATYATLSIAEYFRDQGLEVMCIVDSITRFAMAQREIGLSIGEPPTTKGYTPSVFTELPKVLERAGPGIDGTNITAFFSVLVEGDDSNEPITDAVRGILDGHIVLSREIAERNRFPAIDVLKSISRTMPGCNNELENRQVGYARKMLALYNDMADMIKIGAYRKGSDPEIDKAIILYQKLEEFMTQNPSDSSTLENSFKELGEIIGIAK